MNNGRKIAAAAGALLIGATTYGVYATQLGVNNTDKGFYAGSVGQTDSLPGLNVDLTPTLAPHDTTGAMDFTGVSIAPASGTSWAGEAGQTIKVTGLNSSGTQVTTGTATVPGSKAVPSSAPINVTTPAVSTNSVNSWVVTIINS